MITHHGPPSEFQGNFSLNWENKIITWLESEIGFEKFNPGFSRLDYYLSDIPQKIKLRNIKIVTVAGTNGKGEVCHRLGQHLKDQNISFSLWTSPHILSIRERFVTNGEEISYLDLWQRIESLHLSMEESGIELSFYEFLFVVFMFWALEQNSSVLILEVGLGGKLDGVNYFDADVVGLPSISRDHQEILGNSYQKILAEKLGVLREGSTLISTLELRYLQKIVNQHSIHERYLWRDLFQEGLVNVKDSYSTRNSALSWQLALEVFKLKNQHNFFMPISPRVSFKGRNEKVTINGRRFIFIGAHNLDGLRKLVDSQTILGLLNVLWLVAFSQRDKADVLGMLRILANTKDGEEIWASFFQHPKALSKEVLSELIQSEDNIGEKINYSFNWKELITCEKYQSKTFLVTGSYYFIGEVQRFLLQEFSI